MASTNIRKLGPKDAAQVIKAAYQIKRPVMLWGAPGTAKSAIVRMVAKELGVECSIQMLAQVDAVDLRGLPYKSQVIENGIEHTVMGFAQSNILPRGGNGILMLDELVQAPVLVQNAASELILDRKVGEYYFPDGWLVVAAGNRRGDRAGTLEMPSHLKNRLIHVEVVVDAPGWCEWAANNNINTHVISFIKGATDALHEFDADKIAYPTLRTWEYVSDIVNAGIKGKTREAMIQGCLGEERAVEFCRFLERVMEMPSYEDVIRDPMRVPIERMKKSSLSVLVNTIAGQAKAEDIDSILKFLSRLSPEDAKYPLLLMANRDPEFKKLPVFQKALKELSEKEEEEATKG